MAYRVLDQPNPPMEDVNGKFLRWSCHRLVRLEVGGDFWNASASTARLSSSAADTPIRACRCYLRQRNVTYSVSVKRNEARSNLKRRCESHGRRSYQVRFRTHATFQNCSPRTQSLIVRPSWAAVLR